MPLYDQVYIAYIFLNCVGSIIGQSHGLRDLPSVQHVIKIEAYICMKYIENSHVYSVFRNQASLLSELLLT